MESSEPVKAQTFKKKGTWQETNLNGDQHNPWNLPAAIKST